MWIAQRVGFSAHYNRLGLRRPGGRRAFTHLQHLLDLRLPTVELGDDFFPRDVCDPLSLVWRPFAVGDAAQGDEVEELSSRDLIGDDVLRPLFRMCAQ